MAQIKAFCWRSGLIQYGEDVPEGALLIAAGPERPLKRVIGELAVHGWEPGQLFVGELALAGAAGEPALNILAEFQGQVQPRLVQAIEAEVRHGQA